jgi:hypothetical protein
MPRCDDSTAEQPIRKSALALLALVWSVALSLGLLQYWMPPDYWPPLGANYPGVASMKAFFGIEWISSIDSLNYADRFRGLLSVSVIGYIALLALVWAQKTKRTRLLNSIASIFVIAYSITVPAGLSCDVYAYVAYARMVVLYDLNPYFNTQLEISNFNDPIAEFLQWDLPSPYGPLWSALSAALVLILQYFSLDIQVLWFKLISGIALLGIAHQTAGLAERFYPGRGGLAYLSVISCPFLLFEGPGMGHNDLVLVFLLLWGFRFFYEGRCYLGALAIGLGAAVKFIPMVILPWLIWIKWRWNSGTIWSGLLIVFLVLSPIVLAAIPFATNGVPSEGVKVLITSFENSGGGAHFKLSILTVLYCILSLRLLQTESKYLLTAWVIFALGLIIISARPVFPWYLSWPLCVALIHWHRFGIVLSLMIMGLAFRLMLGYAAAPHAT